MFYKAKLKEKYFIQAFRKMLSFPTVVMYVLINYKNTLLSMQKKDNF